MPYAVKQFQATPNPNALKCVLEPALPEPIRSFRKREDAAGDRLGEALFDIPGVTSVLLSGGWMTVNKAPSADWGPVKKGVQDVLKRA